MSKDKPILIQYVHERVLKRNKNFVMLFIGPTGSGKSYSALRMAELLDPTFNINRVCFKAKDFMNVVNGLVKQSEKEGIKGKVIVWDEFGVEHNSREFMTISNRVINYFFQTSRHLNLIVIMTVPLLSFIDSATRKLCHAVAEMQGINTQQKLATVKVKMLQVNVLSGKEYPKYLRYKNNGRGFALKRFKFGLPTKQLLEDYEKKKKDFTTSLNEEIMSKLLKDEAKAKRNKKALTPRQEEVATLLSTHSMDEVSEKLGLQKSSLFLHKQHIEKKGYIFEPVWKDKRVICYNIKGLQQKTNRRQNETQD